MNLHRNISRAILSLALLYAAPSAYPTTLSASAFVSRNIRDVSTCRPTTSWTFFFFFLASQARMEEAYEKSLHKSSVKKRKTSKERRKRRRFSKEFSKGRKIKQGENGRGEKREKKEEKDTNRIPIISPLIQTSNRGRYRVVSYRGVSKRRKKKSKGGKRKISRRDI